MNKDSTEAERRKHFDRVVGVHCKDLYRFAAWLSRDPEIAKVIVQESLLRAWKSLDRLRDDALAKHWLLTIVRRENARYFASGRLETVDIDRLTPAQQQMIATNENPEIEEMRRAILQLHVKYREPLVLQVLMGYSTAEIAEVLGIKRGAVLTRLHRARLKLKDRMTQAEAA